MADPDFELRWGPDFVLLALPAFLPSAISSFFTQNKGGGGGHPRSATVLPSELVFPLDLSLTSFHSVAVRSAIMCSQR